MYLLLYTEIKKNSFSASQSGFLNTKTTVEGTEQSLARIRRLLIKLSCSSIKAGHSGKSADDICTDIKDCVTSLNVGQAWTLTGNVDEFYTIVRV